MLAALLCLVGGFAALCLAMERHHEEALAAAPTPARQRGLRGLALLLGLASLAGPWPRSDYGIAWTEWVALLSLAGLVAVALATWRPSWLPAVGGLAALAGLAGLFF